MGQRHQYVVTFPEQYYSENNPNNKPAVTRVIHHQWLYGVNAIMTAHRVLKLINRAVASPLGGTDYLFGTDTSGSRLFDDAESAIAAAMSIDVETGYFHRVYMQDPVVPEELDGSKHLDNNDGVTVIKIVAGSKLPLFCFAAPYGVEGTHYRPSMGNGPWTASEYLALYYTADEIESKFSAEDQKTLAVALREIEQMSVPMTENQLQTLHPMLRDAPQADVIQLPLQKCKGSH